MTDTFHPPTPEQTEAWLDQHTLRQPSALAMWAPLLVLGMVLVTVLMVGGVWGVLLPWVALGGVFAYMTVRLRRAKKIDQRLTQAQELAMLRHHERALAMGWRLLPSTHTAPGLYVRTMTLLGHCLETVKAYEQAIACFDRLLDLLSEHHPSAVQLQIHRAIASLGAEHLLDADDTLRQLRGRIHEYADTPTAALYRFARLMQTVATGHYDDALADADTLLDELRPLGIEAGYGHALMALCYRQSQSRGSDPAGRDTNDDAHAHAAAQAEHREQADEQAARWWRRATTLLPAEALIERFPQLKVMEERA